MERDQLPTKCNDCDRPLCAKCGECHAGCFLSAPSCDEQQEPDQNDEVLCCPDCETPNQFGELCAACVRERNAEYEDQQRTPRWDESACMGSMD